MTRRIDGHGVGFHPKATSTGTVKLAIFTEAVEGGEYNPELTPAQCYELAAELVNAADAAHRRKSV